MSRYADKIIESMSNPDDWEILDYRAFNKKANLNIWRSEFWFFGCNTYPVGTLKFFERYSVWVSLKNLIRNKIVRNIDKAKEAE